MYKNHYTVLLCAILSVFAFMPNIQAQEFLPFVHSPYAGVSSVGFQPADIAASRYRFDMTILGVSAQLSNDYLGLERSQLFNYSNYDQENYHKKYLGQNLNGDPKTGIVSAQIQVASFMISFDDKSAFAFTSRARSFVNADNVSEDLAILLYENLDYQPLQNQKLKNQNLRMSLNNWAEYGLTYARVIIDKGPHMLKAGATVKLLQGLGGAYISAELLDYSVQNKDSISIYNSQFRYGTSNNIDQDFNYTFVSNPSFGLDLGAVYLYRPEHEKYRYEMDGEEGLYRRDLYDYKFKAGISITDLGYLNYDKGYNSQDFYANVENWNISAVKVDNIQELTDTLINRFGTNGTETSFKMQLPTVISMQFDYNLYQRIFLNFSPYIAFRQGDADIHKVHHITNFSFTPHYETYGFGVSLPLQYNNLGQFNAGIGFRFGMFWVGSNTLLGSLFQDYTRDVDLSFAFKIPVRYKGPRDADGDKVSDAKDLCPDVPGLWINEGCPEAVEPPPPPPVEIVETDTIEVEIIDPLELPPPPEPIEEIVVEIPEEPTVVPETKPIRFKLNSSELEASSFEALNNIVAFLLDMPESKVLIKGYTDTSGADAYNLALSAKRAKSVSEYLVKQGIAQERIATKGMGEKDPIAPNETIEGRRKNRRAEIEIIIL